MTKLLKDVDIRKALIHRIETTDGIDESSILVEEVGLCQGTAIADVAVFGNRFLGFEIKSDVDSLDRLRGQISIYGRVFDEVTIVAVARHVPAILELVPACWGVIQASATDDGVQLAVHRFATSNPLVEDRSIAELLWADETMEILKARSLHVGLRNRARKFAWDRLCTALDSRELRRVVTATLRKRRGWKPVKERRTFSEIPEIGV